MKTTNELLKVSILVLFTFFIGISTYSQALIKDFHTGKNLEASIYVLVSYNNQLFFGARNNGVNNRFWKTDGTFEGTSIIHPLYKSSNGGYETFLNVSDAYLFRNKLYLKIIYANQTEFWVTDGTKEGTKRSNPMGDECKIPTFAGHTDYPEFLRLNNSVFFRCGFDYFKSDGTSYSINKDSFNYWDFKAITEWKNHLILVKDNYDLYITGSSPSGVKEITNSEVSLYNNQAIGVDSLIFFSGTSNKTGYGLWCYSEKNDSTFLVKALESYPPNRFIAINGKVVFSVGLKTYVSDGTDMGTYPLHSLHIYQVENYPFYINYNNKLYFAAQDGVHGYELWRTDGTLEGTSLVKDINIGNKFSGSAPSGFIEFKGEFYFNAGNGTKSGIWKSDGTPDGTVPVLLAGPAKYFTVNNDQLFMVLDDGVHGAELWVTDGTEEGSQLVRDINPNPYMSFATKILGETSEGLVIASFENDTSYLYLSDGSTEGTFPYHKAYARSPANIFLYKYNNKLFFDGINDVLWSTDGTPEGTTYNEDISKPRNFFKFKDKLYFAATSKYTMLYSSTEDIATADFFSRAIEPHGFVEYKNHFYFLASDNDHGEEIWKSDGTTEGTGMLVDLVPGTRSSGVRSLIVFDDLLLFSWKGETINSALWYSDGTAEGTQRLLNYEGNEISSNVISLIISGKFVTDIESIKKLDTNSSEPIFINNYLLSATEIGEKWFYSGKTISGEYEPWCSDGTDEGTYQITNQNGNLSSNPKHFIGLGSRIFFTLFDENYGRELWVTDGTEGNATLFFDADPGLGSGNPTYFTKYKGDLFFLADDGVHGRNLYKISGTETTGVENITIQNLRQKVYPNPVKDILWFEKSSQNITCIQILNINGIVVQSKFGKSLNSIDVSSLSSGLYIVKTKYENGFELNQKIIKQ